MASESLPAPSKITTSTARSGAASSFALRDIAAAILGPLSSLKLTVFLLIAATVVTWIATLDQTRFDIWQVKNKHFHNVLVEVPFQTFFVPGWFPELQNVKGSFYVPSGVTILVAMLVNLAAAHLLRFKLQAKGLWDRGGVRCGDDGHRTKNRTDRARNRRRVGVACVVRIVLADR